MVLSLAVGAVLSFVDPLGAGRLRVGDPGALLRLEPCGGRLGGQSRFVVRGGASEARGRASVTVVLWGEGAPRAPVSAASGDGRPISPGPGSGRADGWCGLGGDLTQRQA